MVWYTIVYCSIVQQSVVEYNLQYGIEYNVQFIEYRVQSAVEYSRVQQSIVEFVEYSSVQYSVVVYIQHEARANLYHETPQSALGGLKKARFSSSHASPGVKNRPGRPLGRLLERLGCRELSRNPPGGLLERSWRLLSRNKSIWNGSWPAQDKFQERFQPKQKYRERPKSAQEEIQERKQAKSLQFFCVFVKAPVFNYLGSEAEK